MCGIIAKISIESSNPIKTLNGIKELEYRGYDSYGILLFDIENNCNILKKEKGTLNEKTYKILSKKKSNIELGHTRWATHGNVTKENAHPHYDSKKEFFVIMNGIIENHKKIKEELIRNKINCKTETDTEIIPHLYSFYMKNIIKKDIKEKLISATKKIIEKIKGEYSFVVKYKNFLIAYKNVNPLIIGKDKDEYFISSDSGLVQNNSKEYIILEDKEICILQIKKNEEILYEHYDKDFNFISKNFNQSYKHLEKKVKKTKYYMEEEILEQINLRKIITEENKKIIEYLAKNAKGKKIYLSAAGTSYNAALYMHYSLLEKGVLSFPIIASELKNYNKVIKNSLIIVFSQSGETADLINILKTLKENNEIISITNSINSTIDRTANKNIHLNCGKEIAVSSTKAFTHQLFISIWLICEIENKKVKDFKTYEKLFNHVLNRNLNTIMNICIENEFATDFFFIGRNKNYPLALEGALKLKKTTCLHAEGFAGGELKHGTLTLIEEKTPAIVIGEDEEIIGNAIEMKTRGAIIIGIGEVEREVYDYFIKVPRKYKDIFITLMLQYFAYEMAIMLKIDPDKPRNLAKSVTVK